MEDTYKTKDIAEASTLVVKGIKYLKIETEEKVCFFIFQNSAERESFSRDYYFNQVLVNARTFYETFVRLKHQIFNEIPRRY